MDPVHPDERGVNAREYLGDDGVALIEHFWDVIAPLRACEPSRSIAHCEGCGNWWYVPGKAKAPSACAMRRRCQGVVHKAFKVVPATEARRLAEQKAKRNGARASGTN